MERRRHRKMFDNKELADMLYERDKAESLAFIDELSKGIANRRKGSAGPVVAIDPDHAGGISALSEEEQDMMAEYMDDGDGNLR